MLNSAAYLTVSSKPVKLPPKYWVILKHDYVKLEKIFTVITASTNDTL